MLATWNIVRALEFPTNYKQTPERCKHASCSKMSGHVGVANDMFIMYGAALLPEF